MSLAAYQAHYIIVVVSHDKTATTISIQHECRSNMTHYVARRALRRVDFFSGSCSLSAFFLPLPLLLGVLGFDSEYLHHNSFTFGIGRTFEELKDRF
jgi:hypothetical protein